jgi:hypothetical protein
MYNPIFYMDRFPRYHTSIGTISFSNHHFSVRPLPHHQTSIVSRYHPHCPYTILFLKNKNKNKVTRKGKKRNERETMPQSRSISTLGDPRWYSTSPRFAAYAPLVVLSPLILAILQIVLAGVWVTNLKGQLDLYVPIFLICPGPPFFSIYHERPRPHRSSCSTDLYIPPASAH